MTAQVIFPAAVTRCQEHTLHHCLTTRARLFRLHGCARRYLNQPSPTIIADFPLRDQSNLTLRRDAIGSTATMDTHNVLQSSQYVQLLLDQQQKLRDAQTRKGQHPTRPPRAQVILQFQLKLMASRAKVAAVGQQASHIKTSFVPLPYPPCVVPFSNLKKIMIDDLLLETHHRGTYLLVRSVTPQDRMNAVMAIVEDEKGDVLMVQLYHQEDDADGRAEDILFKGMVLILKEPYLKLMSDGNYGLRVDHLSDVVFLSANDERTPRSWQRELAEHGGTALAWKTKGNHHFNTSAYRSAIEWYVIIHSVEATFV